jgi:hypothetical protein
VQDLGRSLFMRVPCPAASTSAATSGWTEARHRGSHSKLSIRRAGPTRGRDRDQDAPVHLRTGWSVFASTTAT